MKASFEKNFSIKKAVMINGAAKYYGIICSLIVNAILARILTPGDYGVVAVATVFITFFSLFSDLGFGTAYIQEKELNDLERDELFTFLTYIGVILFVVFFFFSYGIAWFYGSSIYLRVSQLLGLNLFFTAMNVIPYSDLLKRHRFATIGITQGFATTLSSVLAVLFARLGLSYYSIVLQSLINILIQIIVYIRFSGVRITLTVHSKTIKKILGFSLGQAAFNFINYFSRNIDNLLIGKMLGKDETGYYDKAYKTSGYLISNFSSIIGRSIYPVLSSRTKQKKEVFSVFKTTFMFLVIVGSFFSVFLNLSAKEVILFLYGDQWKASITAFSYLSLSLFAQMSLNVTGPFYQVLNNTRLLAVSGFISACIIVTGICFGLWKGTIENVAFCYLVAESINFAITVIILEKYLFEETDIEMNKDLLTVICGASLIYTYSKMLFNQIRLENIFLGLLIKGSIIGVLFIVFLFLSGMIKYIRKVIRF